MQWNSFALQLTATAVVFSFSLPGNSRTGFLLILPVITYVLGSHYTSSYIGMQNIAIYIMEELSPRVPNGLNWEEWRRRYARSHRGSGYPSFYLPPPTVFPVVSVIALAWTTPYIVSNIHLSGLSRTFLAVIWGLDVGITFVGLYTMTQAQRYYNAPNMGLPLTDRHGSGRLVMFRRSQKPVEAPPVDDAD
jgi:hypothetical protein